VSEKTRLRKRFEAMRAARFGIIKRIFWAFRKDPVMTRMTRRTLARGGALGAAGALASAAAPALATPAMAQSATLRWRMVTSWPKRLPGPGMSAERLAERIGALSGGRLDIVVSAAGEVVPAFGVLDAVGSGVAEMGHSAAFYWQGKEPAAAFFTTVPFGLLPNEHVAWIDAGGGQALWDELYAPFGVKPFMAGNTGVCMGGWFRREIKSRDDVRGLKIRSLGLGGEVYRRLGAIPQTTAPAEILVALQSGVIDGAEFVGPGSDIALGLYRYAPFYYGPGFNKPNGTGECIVNLKAWQGLDAELQAIVTSACAVEASYALAEMERLNIEALAALTGKDNVQLRTFPSDLIAAARATAKDVLAELAGKSAIAAKVSDSYVAFGDKVAVWSRISTQAVLQARQG
jgi:TRAP-type mannitol/chloroaromatic compound transport system substrate-binding protein